MFCSVAGPVLQRECPCASEQIDRETIEQSAARCLAPASASTLALCCSYARCGCGARTESKSWSVRSRGSHAPQIAAARAPVEMTKTRAELTQKSRSCRFQRSTAPPDSPTPSFPLPLPVPAYLPLPLRLPPNSRIPFPNSQTPKIRIACLLRAADALQAAVPARRDGRRGTPPPLPASLQEALLPRQAPRR